jgi:hypothetical protein
MVDEALLQVLGWGAVICFSLLLTPQVSPLSVPQYATISA